MKILYVSDAQSVHTKRWAEHFRSQGREVHVASFRPATIEGVTVHLLPSLGLGRVGYFLAVPTLRRLYRKIQPDVVHAQYVTSYGFLAALAGLKPLVITAWGSDVVVAPRRSRLMRLFAGYALSKADAVTTVAEHMNSAVAELGVPAGKVRAIPFGVDLLRFTPVNPLPSEARPIRMISTRNFSPIYSVHTLIEAVHRVRRRGVPVSLDLVGEGPLRSSLEALARDLGIEALVTFHGHVDVSRLAELLRRSDVFISPALSDGNNVSLNEAMASGVFPIATDIPANAQWIKHGEGGFLYAPGDVGQLAECLEKASADPALRERAAKSNRKIIESRADWRACVEQMSQIYRSVMQKQV